MKKIIFTLFLAIISATAFAAGPFYMYEKPEGGFAARTWVNGTIRWVYDEGPLGTFPASPKEADKAKCKALETDVTQACKYMMSTCGASTCVAALFDKWASKKFDTGDGTLIGPNNIKVINGGSIGKDINSGNFSIKDGYSGSDLSKDTILVVFDTGEEEGILDKAGYSNVLGLSGLYPDDKEAKNYTGGWVVLNAKKTTGTDFAATILHELGHVLGLDHSQLQRDAMDAANNEKEETGVPTMYPYLLGDLQETLHDDDIISLSMLYPTDAFKNSFCRIEGDLVDKDGNPYQGVNVVAYASGTAQFIDSRSFVTGAMYPPCSSDKGSGHYILGGLRPGTPYYVIYEPIYQDFRNYTYGMNPFNEEICVLNPGTEESGYVTFGGKQLVACSAKTIGNIESDHKDANGILTNVTVPAESVYVETKGTINAGTTGLTTTPTKEEASSGKKAWCGSTIMGGPTTPVLSGFMPLLAGFALLLLRPRKK